MGVWLQLKILCWKNYLSRKRKPVRLAFELLLPIVLFIFLTLLRRLGDRVIYHDCHFKPKAMPSAGILSLAQTAFCSINNTCEDSTFNASLEIYENSYVEIFGKAIEDTFQLSHKKLAQYRSEINETSENDGIELTKYIAVLRKAVMSDEELKNSSIAQVLNEYEIAERTKYKCGLLYTADENQKVDTDIKVPLDDDDSPMAFMSVAENAICGKNVPSVLQQMLALADRGFVSETEIGRKIDDLGIGKPQEEIILEPPPYENDTSEFCNDIMLKLESNISTRLFWKVVKPFIRGKVLFYPNAPAVKVMFDRLQDDFKKVGSTILSAVKGKGLRELFADVMKSRTFFQVLTESIKDEFPAWHKILAKSTDAPEETLRSIFQNWYLQSNNLVADIKKQIRNYLECIDWDRYVGFDDRQKAEESAMEFQKYERLWALVDFTNVPLDATKLPKIVQYKIRTGIERTHGTNQIRDRVYRPKVRRDPLIDLKHITGGFAYIQDIVEGEIIKEQTGRTRVPGIYLKQTPYPCHLLDKFRESISKTLPLFMVISWLFPFSIMIKKIVTEKECKLTQTLRIIGVGKFPHWMSWFIDTSVPMVVVTFFLTIILSVGNILPNTEFILIWLFLLAFIFPVITFGFFLSTLLNRASIAAASCGLIFLLCYLPYPTIATFEEDISPTLKLFACLIPNIAFGLGCTWFTNMEELAIGGQFSNMDVSPIPGNPISLSLIIGFFFLDALIFLLIALYIENVWPGDGGLRRPFYYLFLKSYWFGRDTDDDRNKPNEDLDPAQFERDPRNSIVGVSLRNVTKKCGLKTIIRNVSLDMYDSQITSILGHNGSGKSTLIGLMTGLLQPTSGTILLYGVSIKGGHIKNRDIGICFQENVIVEDLTVFEQLYFYGRLKGADPQTAEKDARDMMKDVGLSSKEFLITSTLSMGMMRKLCVGTAFIGGSKIVFLDEPTAWVDVPSRKGIWDILSQNKDGRTIVLTTHRMDEADALSDRMVLLGNGKVFCSGSASFIKSKQPLGYTLTVECEPGPETTGVFCKAQSGKETKLITDLTKVVTSAVPEAKFTDQTGCELNFAIPSKVNIRSFDGLFSALDREKSKLRIQAYGLSDASLEGVFVKLVQDSEVPASRPTFCCCFHCPEKEKEDTDEKDKSEEEIKRIWPRSFLLRAPLDIFALVVKLCHHYSRHYGALLCLIILPAIFVTSAVFLSNLLPSARPMPPLEIDISAYSPSDIFYSLENPTHANSLMYEKELLRWTGVGSKCVMEPYTCKNQTIGYGSLALDKDITDNYTACPCNEGRYLCSEEPTDPPHAEMGSGDVLYNLTTQNISNWVVKTELSKSYIRYGGLSLGVKSVYNSLGFLDVLEIFSLPSIMLGLNLFPPSKGEFNFEATLSSAFKLACQKRKALKTLEGADISDNIVIWYNNRGWISAISLMNAASNMVLRASLPPGENPSEYAIHLTNHPLPMTIRQLEKHLELTFQTALLHAMGIMVALAFIPATFIVVLISERSTGFKQLQLITGLGRTVYWVTAFFFDLFLYTITLIVLVLIFFLFESEELIGPAPLKPFLTLLFSFAIVSTVMVYPFSFFFDSPAAGFIVVSIFNVFIGSVTLLSMFVLTTITKNPNPYHLNDIFMIVPQFSVGRGVFNLLSEHSTSEAFKKLGATRVVDLFAWELTSKYIFVMLFEAFLFFLVVIVIEVSGICVRHSGRTPKEYDDEDADVKAERKRINDKDTEDDVLVLSNVSKWYSHVDRPAVDKVCLGLKPGDCFGLIGLNGAGKTTLFKMITGCLKPSSGKITILGKKVMKSSSGLPVGYCPQEHALDPYLTPTETLNFFGRLHGYYGKTLTQTVNKTITRTGLQDQKYKQAKNLSGGNKRKLSCAIAFVGDPPVLLLDEPTSGMDPQVRRLFWQCIQTCMQEGRCIVLSTHNMEECQNLCTQSGILVNGRLKCLGTNQHLVTRFDEGYTLTVNMTQTASLADVKAYLSSKLSIKGSIEDHNLGLKMQLAPGASLGKVFVTLEDAKKDNLVRDFTITQTNLEQVFTKFVKEQETEDVVRSTSPMDRLMTFCCRSLQGSPKRKNIRTEDVQLRNLEDAESLLNYNKNTENLTT